MLHRVRVAVLAITAIAMLAGCAPRAALKERATREDVRASWGTPRIVQPGAAGERWVFTNAPDGGRETWFVNFDETGRLSSYAQVLTEERTQQVRAGMTQADVEALIGPSYYSIRFPLRPDAINHIYRYQRPDLPICFYVEYDNAGKVMSTATRNDRVGNPGLERPCL